MPNSCHIKSVHSQGASIGDHLAGSFEYKSVSASKKGTSEKRRFDSSSFVAGTANHQMIRNETHTWTNGPKTSSLFAVQQPNLWVTPQTLKKYSHEGKSLESGTPLLTLEEACDHKTRVSKGHIQSAESKN